MPYFSGMPVGCLAEPGANGGAGASTVPGGIGVGGGEGFGTPIPPLGCV
ncbi:MAG TPA: hypothetical protein VNY51_09415 [Candidatus Dormibacteraeota bacterium]|nr:hypothetical protein [Candidatus Dormibacteraeota bacterium]